MIPDPAIVGTGYRAQFDAAVVGLKRLDQFSAVRRESMLEVDAGERRRQLAKVTGGSADQSTQLAERPVGRGHRLSAAGDGEREAADVVGPRFNAE